MSVLCIFLKISCVGGSKTRLTSLLALRYNSGMKNIPSAQCATETIVVNNSAELAQAIAKAQPHTQILLQAGVYRCKAEIDTPYLSLVGATGNPADVAIVWDDYAKRPDEQGVELNTFRTYTLAVCAPHVRFAHLTVANTAGRSPQKGQEVALSVLGDDFRAENCRLVSEQDTLFCGPLPPDLIERYNGFLKDKLRIGTPCRQKYIRCTVCGTVDFVFGCGDCLFEQCTFISAEDGRTGFVAAPAHTLQQQVGFVFHRCAFVPGPSAAECLECAAERKEPSFAAADVDEGLKTTCEGCKQAQKAVAQAENSAGNAHCGQNTAESAQNGAENGITASNTDIANATKAASSVFLARPWRDYGKASFVQCTYGTHIDVRGFDKWNDTFRDKTARFGEDVHCPGRVAWTRALPQEDVDRLLKHFE